MPAIRNYLIVTASYWGFTLVDGALRMLVLLHFFQQGYTPFTLAFLFLLYELGLAKDFTKTASKSAIKATSIEGAGQLFRWVAWFTGSKNAMKGIGFFAGGLLLELVGFRPELSLMAALLSIILVCGLLTLPTQLGKAKSSKTVRELFGKSRGVNLLAAARIFLFGARDVWFVVGLPVFLYANGWRLLEVGAFLAAWTIAYGGVQALAPGLVTRSTDGPKR